MNNNIDNDDGYVPLVPRDPFKPELKKPESNASQNKPKVIAPRTQGFKKKIIKS